MRLVVRIQPSGRSDRNSIFFGTGISTVPFFQLSHIREASRFAPIRPLLLPSEGKEHFYSEVIITGELPKKRSEHPGQELSVRNGTTGIHKRLPPAVPAPFVRVLTTDRPARFPTR